MSETSEAVASIPVVDINYASLPERITGGERLTVKGLALELGLKESVVKNSLINHFGTNIQFVRGRTGGIRFNPVS